jgi:aquaporin Z
VSGLGAALRRNYPEYLCEALGLGLFMMSAGTFGVWIFGGASPLAALDPLLLRALMGLAMGSTAIALIYSPWGRRSGAHYNPATTLMFWRLGKIETADAIWYAAAQCAGGLLGVLVVRTLLGGAFTAPPVRSVATLPGPAGAGYAFLAEAAISALLMIVVLHTTNTPSWAKRTGLLAGALVACYITFESPVSGMSMNPARTLASALPSGMYTALWVYLLAPPLGMLAAAELYLRSHRQGAICAKLCHDDDHRCIFRCGYCLH